MVPLRAAGFSCWRAPCKRVDLQQARGLCLIPSCMDKELPRSSSAAGCTLYWGPQLRGAPSYMGLVACMVDPRKGGTLRLGGPFRTQGPLRTLTSYNRNRIDHDDLTPLQQALAPGKS